MGRITAGLLRLSLLALGIATTTSTRAARAMPPAPWLRDPQVTLTGTGLRDYLASVGESIDPTMAQSRIQVFQATISNPLPMFLLEFELGPHTPGTTFGSP